MPSLNENLVPPERNPCAHLELLSEIRADAKRNLIIGVELRMQAPTMNGRSIAELFPPV
jgi:hypothetical protein